MARHLICKKTQSSRHTIPPQLAALCAGKVNKNKWLA
jgi:hypothetical protein